MTFDDELMTNFIPLNVQVSLGLNKNLEMIMILSQKEDRDLRELADKVKDYHENFVRTMKWGNLGRTSGVLLKVPIVGVSSEVSQKYYLHIFGDYVSEEEPLTPLKLLRAYVRNETNSPRIFWRQVVSAYGCDSDRVDVQTC